MWTNVVEPGRPQMIIWRMRIACWILKATHTHTHTRYVILFAFPLLQWLHERASMLRCTYFACLVLFRMCSVRLNGERDCDEWRRNNWTVAVFIFYIRRRTVFLLFTSKAIIRIVPMCFDQTMSCAGSYQCRSAANVLSQSYLQKLCY